MTSDAASLADAALGATARAQAWTWAVARRLACGASCVKSRLQTHLSNSAFAACLACVTAPAKRVAPLAWKWLGTVALASRCSTQAKTRCKNWGAHSPSCSPRASGGAASGASAAEPSSSSRHGVQRSTASKQRRAARVLAASLASTANRAAFISGATTCASGAWSTTAPSTAAPVKRTSVETQGRAPSKKAARHACSSFSRNSSETASSVQCRVRRSSGRASAARARRAAGAWCAHKTALASVKAARSRGTTASATQRGTTPLRSRKAEMLPASMYSWRE
mmetsp:Transcript_30416/g.105075  ORF Transcript_30416/g.105075 Transcript_30416/m.105075 type:complete len:281 (-) Transcript_30416:175-1017(-)